ncbi:MAG: glycoside hydrolase family 127 protein, partial [Catenulispora sp.]|nr:glycoside hydrolase family 127 protein [Catenulispora sp.]
LLETAGNLHNLRLAAGQASGEYRGDLPFLDSDVYKWLEAAAWTEGEHGLDPAVVRARDAVVALVRAAQRDDGYLNSWFQVAKDGERWADLRWGHELYCAGHLIQAAVAQHRATGDGELLRIAIRFADCVDSAFGPDKKIDGVCGHAEVETALVELYRETGEQRYLDLASYFVDRRGHGLLNPEPTRGTAPGPAYCQDHVPVRDATAVAGHAVRQLYYLAGVTDVAAETGDPALRDAAERLWSEMAARKTHITGGLGAHHAEEDFGDPYELPNERAYCETCAAIASVHWSWRMALLTGEAKYSDLVERTLFNAVLPGVSLDGTRWLYANPLQVRDEHVDRHGDHGVRRTAWFRCACCPPNVMRLLASLPHYFASTDADGLQLHQYATGSYDGAVRVETGYPWDGGVAVTIERGGEWTLSLRVPAWCEEFDAAVNGVTAVPSGTGAGWLRIRRDWQAGDVVSLNLAMPVRLTAADPRVDAVRGCAAIERGPLVYCLEEGDQPVRGLDAFVLDTSTTLTAEHDADLLDGVTVVRGLGRRRAIPETGWWPYRSGTRSDPLTEPLPFTAIPYYAWANRQDGAMRIWLPMA